MKLSSITFAFVAAAIVGHAEPALSADPVSFEGKSVKLIIPSTAGGGTDAAARLVGKYLGKYLPGNPTVVPQNMPGGGGITSLNFLAQQAKPDGLTIVVSSSTQADPITYRTPQAQYNPAKLGVIGGFATGDDVLVIRTEAQGRLFDKSQPPVIMGAVSGQPRRGMRMVQWGNLFLGWNIKWVGGYPGTTELMLALQRGEIDMSTFGREYLADKLTDTTKFRVLYAEGVSKDERPIGRPDLDNVAKFVDLMQDKVSDPKMKAAYDYWRAGFMFKWVTLPPETPRPIVDAYQEAFVKLGKDPEFIQQGDQVMQGFSVIAPKDMVQAINALEATPDEALKTTEELQRNLK